MKKVSFYTLGCKLNQAETAILAEQFEQGGYQLVPFGQSSDICIINTCTVTAKSDYRCRQMIRKSKKISPSAKIAVVGCYAQLNPEKIKEIDGVDFILGSDRKFDLLKIFEEGDRKSKPLLLPSDNDLFLSPGAGDFWDHTRAFVKIQDGCDSFCSYCTVPLARGRSRSDDLNFIFKRTRELAERGHQEIVLTGVHIGRYGQDLTPPKSLLDVLKKLESIENLKRIRLSSLEPLEVNDDLLHWIGESEKICHHFHIPLQSGDDEILKQMNRNYDSKTIGRILEKIKSILPDCGLGTDVIVGFPGETVEHFQNTVRLVEETPFTYLHVFSFSPRPGTKAATFRNRVIPKEIKRRSEILRGIGRSKKYNFYKGLIDKNLKVLWEEKQRGDWMFGFSGNYARVRTKSNPEFMNKFGMVEIKAAEPDFVTGDVIQE